SQQTGRDPRRQRALSRHPAERRKELGGMLPGDRRHLCPGHQALRGDLRLLRRRTIGAPSWPLNHLKPTDAARLRDVQLDVHFAVYTHTDTSLTRGEIRMLPPLSARGDQLSAYSCYAW